MTLATALLAVGGTHTGGSKSPVALLIVGIFFVVIGGTQTANPQLLWRLSRWQYKNPDANEPSDKAFVLRRVVGAIFVVIGIVLVVVASTKL